MFQRSGSLSRVFISHQYLFLDNFRTCTGVSKENNWAGWHASPLDRLFTVSDNLNRDKCNTPYSEQILCSSSPTQNIKLHSNSKDAGNQLVVTFPIFHQVWKLNRFESGCISSLRVCISFASWIWCSLVPIPRDLKIETTSFDSNIHQAILPDRHEKRAALLSEKQARSPSSPPYLKQHPLLTQCHSKERGRMALPGCNPHILFTRTCSIIGYTGGWIVLHHGNYIEVLGLLMQKLEASKILRAQKVVVTLL